MPKIRFIFFVFLFLPAALKANANNFTGKVFVTQPTKLWTEPTKFGEPIAELELGLELNLVSYSTTGAWARAMTPSGREGWILIRHTSLSGIRSEPVGRRAVGSDSRLPASEGAPQLLVTQRAPWNFALDLGYANQVNRSAASGILTSIGIDYFMNPKWAWGFGFGYGFFGDSAEALDLNARTQRRTHRLLPHARARFQLHPEWEIAAGLGWDFDRTEFSTRDLTTGALIETNGAGQAVSGAEWGQAFTLRLNPKFLLPMGPGAWVGFQLLSDFTFQFGSGEGNFGGEATNKFVSTLGFGFSFSTDL